MEFEQLKYFTMVVEEKNLTRASEKLHITQSALSKSLIRIAGELEVPLFERCGRRIIPSESGMDFYHWAKETLESYEKLKERVRKQHYMKDNTLTVGISSSALLNPYLMNFRACHREYGINTIMFSSKDFPDILNWNNVDCVITAGECSQEDVEKYLLLTDRIVAVMSRQHPLADLKKKSISIQELRDEIFIFPPAGSVHRINIEKILKRADIVPKVCAGVSSYLQLDMVKHNYGVLLWGQAGVETIENRGDLCVYDLEEDYCYQKHYLMWKREEYDSEVFRQYLSYIVQLCDGDRKEE